MSSQPKAATRSSSRTKIATNTAPSRTTHAAAASRTNAPAPPAAPVAVTKKPSTRKPLLNRANSPDSKTAAIERKPSHASTATKLPTVKLSPSDLAHDVDREPIKAFLRIRPVLGDSGPSSEPYLDPISDTAVRMTDPDSSAHSRLSSVNSSSIYTFSHIFPPETQQSDFFNKTTLPLVKDLLEGQSGLIFTYGVTNSGKTYTIQGGTEEGSAGILPRTLDVIFNSTEGLQGDGRYRPVRLNGIEQSDGSSNHISSHPPTSSTSPALADILGEIQDNQVDIDPTFLKLDRNHEYTIWLSYSEVYNEKVYDLFASVDSPDSPSQPSSSGIPRPTSTFLNMPIPSSQSHPLLLTRKALTLKSCPPSDTGLPAGDASNAGKYVAGLRQIRVKSAAEAKALLKLGQMHRRVFGTLANSQSSRSHALVTIKILRVHRGERNDPSSIQTSRLTLVDLAGSERTKHTQTSGDRLREAGSINKSLMVLGQCMETLRANQRTVARSLATAAGRVDTRDVKKGLAVVPFRHSKLTEVLMDYFVGEGRAVMIVNVNPYDTGFDENSHVMRFSALAREVCTAPATAIPRALPATKERAEHSRTRSSGIIPHRRKVTISTGGPGRKTSEAHLEVLEEDEEPGDEDENDSDDPINPLVDALFDEIEQLRTKLYEAEMRCALVEAETREEVMEEMEERMRAMEKMFKRRLMKEAEQNEKKMDAKIDMINQARTRQPARRTLDYATSDGYADGEEEQETETELEEHVAEDTESDGSRTHRSSDASRSPSPLARKGQGKAGRSTLRAADPDVVLSDDAEYSIEDAMELDGEQAVSQDDDADSILPQDTQSSDGFDEPPRRTARSSRSYSKKKKHDFAEAPSPIFEADVKAGRAVPKRMPVRTSDKLASLAQGLDELSLQEKPRDSTAIVPNRKARQEAIAHAGQGAQYVPQKGEVDTVKKKKRQLGKNRAPTDDEMAAIILGTSQDDSRALRRSGRH